MKNTTEAHIKEVSGFIGLIIHELLERANTHDMSKLLAPEKEIFEKTEDKLRGLTYGTSEYKESLKALGPALKHHYESNRHHPEHFDRGIHNMNLVDIIEMFCDWNAAVKRHADGDIKKSIEHNKQRFNLNPQLVDIFYNTLTFFEEGK